MFTVAGQLRDGSPTDRAYGVDRSSELRRSLRPTFLVAFALVLLQLIIDSWNPSRSRPLAGDQYFLLLAVPLFGVALTYLPPTLLAAETLAVIFDVFFSTTVASFLFTPAASLSGITVALCLKMLATAILIPWGPLWQARSALLTLALFYGGVWLTAASASETHQLVAPILAAILSIYGCRRLDRTHRSLYEHGAALEASGERLSDALAQERTLLGVANETNVLTDLGSVLKRLNRATAEATHSSFSTIFLVHEEDDTLELASTHLEQGSLTHALGTRFPRWSGSALQRAMQRGKTIAIGDIREQDLIPPSLLQREGVQSIALSPIVSHGRLLGVLMAGRTTDATRFDEREIVILTGIAAHAAINIHNARLYEHLSLSESAYRDLFEHANDLIFVADVAGGIHFANQAALQLFDVDAEGLGKLRWTRFLDASEVFRMMRRASIATRRRHAGNASFEVEVSPPGRGDAILEVRVRRISPPGQTPERYQCIARDVTERSRRDEETRALLTRLQESQRLQDEFVANMSHELRTPLNVIIGYADLIADDLQLPIHSDARSFLDRISAASRALHRMVESILEYARLDRGRMIVIPTNFSSDHLLLELHALCNDVRSSFDVKLELTQQRTIEFTTDYDRLYSVLSNLLLNALKFTPKGRVSLRLVGDGDEAVFEVRDTGIGIEPGELRSVFEPFRQVDGSDTRAFGGVGLGLAIVRRNVDLLQGTIDVDSAPSHGTVFEVRVPIVLAGAIPHRAPSAA
jgi:PAS domain S-box-containing protein